LSRSGRQDYIQGTRLAVWQIASLVRAFKENISKTAEHLSCSPLCTQAAMKYGEFAIRAFEVKHWGQRWPSQLSRGYNGYVLSFAEHHQKFRLSNEPMSEAIEPLKLGLNHEPERLALQSVGQTFICPRS
jgi:hypothetical protein